MAGWLSSKNTNPSWPALDQSHRCPGAGTAKDASPAHTARHPARLLVRSEHPSPLGCCRGRSHFRLLPGPVSGVRPPSIPLPPRCCPGHAACPGRSAARFLPSRRYCLAGAGAPMAAESGCGRTGRLRGRDAVCWPGRPPRAPGRGGCRRPRSHPAACTEPGSPCPLPGSPRRPFSRSPGPFAPGLGAAPAATLT